MGKKMIVMVVVLFMFMIIPLAGICADKQIVVRYGSLWPQTNPFSKGDLEYQAKIVKETNGRVKFQNYFAGSLITAREEYEDIAKGVANLATLNPTYTKVGFPI
ncbi:hypothetical protein ACFLZG_02460, partial [Thermodesulfobacteriota bacterium]